MILTATGPTSKDLRLKDAEQWGKVFTGLFFLWNPNETILDDLF